MALSTRSRFGFGLLFLGIGAGGIWGLTNLGLSLRLQFWIDAFSPLPQSEVFSALMRSSLPVLILLAAVGLFGLFQIVRGTAHLVELLAARPKNVWGRSTRPVRPFEYRKARPGAAAAASHWH